MFDNLCGGVRMTLVRPIHSTSVLIGRIWNAHARHLDERISPLALQGKIKVIVIGFEPITGAPPYLWPINSYSASHNSLSLYHLATPFLRDR